MTRLKFIAECEKALVAPSIALENENIRKALETNNDAEVMRLLKEEF